MEVLGGTNDSICSKSRVFMKKSIKKTGFKVKKKL